MNTLNNLLSGHFKNSYGVEGMDITGRSDWKRIVPVSDEMKNHVLEDVKRGFYKYGGMSGNSKAEEDAYYGKIHSYIKSVNQQDRSAVGWTLSQFHLNLANEVSNAVKEKVPGWTPGQQIPSETLDEIFVSERITSIVSGKSSAAENVVPNTDSVEISAEGRLAAQRAKDDEPSEKTSGKVAVNEGKRARQIAAAATKEQVQQVLALLQKDMSDCKAGLEQGMCDETEIAKVEALLSQAKARLSQVPNEADLEDPQGGLSAFEMASLM